MYKNECKFYNTWLGISAQTNIINSDLSNKVYFFFLNPFSFIFYFNSSNLNTKLLVHKNI